VTLFIYYYAFAASPGFQLSSEKRLWGCKTNFRQKIGPNLKIAESHTLYPGF